MPANVVVEPHVVEDFIFERYPFTSPGRRRVIGVPFQQRVIAVAAQRRVVGVAPQRRILPVRMEPL